MNAQFDLVIPECLDEALDVLGGDNGGDATATMPLAGGTSLIVDLRARRVSPQRLVSLAKLDALRGVRLEGDTVRMGGRTTMSDILHDAGLARHASALSAQARVFAGQMVRNTATVAGNICCGSPAADTVPALLALGAEVTLASSRGTRVVPLSAFFHGYKRMERRSDELLTEVSWDLPAERSTSLFYKLGRRRGDAITVAGIAVAMSVAGGKCDTVRIALGALAPIVKRATAAERLLCNKALTPALIEAAAAQAADEAEPIDDIRASANYRRHVAGVLTRRLLTEAWEQLA